MQRYFVSPCDNFDTIDPAPPRQRTWLVLDRARNNEQVAEHHTRQRAREEARRLNGLEAARRSDDERDARDEFRFWEAQDESITF